LFSLDIVINVTPNWGNVQSTKNKYLQVHTRMLISEMRKIL